MVIVYLLLLVLFILAVLFLTEPVRFRFRFHLDEGGIGAEITCLYPFLQIFVSTKDEKPYMLVSIFKIRVYKKRLTTKRKTHSVMDMVLAANPSDIRVTANYGFKDPFRTGIVSGALGMASRYIPIENMQLKPDFISTDDYVHVEGTAKIHVGHMLLGLGKHKNQKTKGGRVQWNKA